MADDPIRSRPFTEKGKENWDRIYGPKRCCSTCGEDKASPACLHEFAWRNGEDCPFWRPSES